MNLQGAGASGQAATVYTSTVGRPRFLPRGGNEVKHGEDSKTGR